MFSLVSNFLSSLGLSLCFWFFLSINLLNAVSKRSHIPTPLQFTWMFGPWEEYNIDLKCTQYSVRKHDDSNFLFSFRINFSTLIKDTRPIFARDSFYLILFFLPLFKEFATWNMHVFWYFDKYESKSVNHYPPIFSATKKNQLFSIVIFFSIGLIQCFLNNPLSK